MDRYRFYNLTSEEMSWDEIFEAMSFFIEKEPTCSYTLSIGTDSQGFHQETRFITGIVLHRKDQGGVGKGAWGCLRKELHPRLFTSLREKISMETTLSQEIACLFDSERLSYLMGLLKGKEASLVMEIHLDIGKKGLTREFIAEMTGRIEAMGLLPRIKPDSYTASGYANRYTK